MVVVVFVSSGWCLRPALDESSMQRVCDKIHIHCGFHELHSLEFTLRMQVIGSCLVCSI
jgi:hypothetical protein